MDIKVMARMICPLPRLGYHSLVPCKQETIDGVKIGEMVLVGDASVAKMSGGDVDVEPYLNSRNTIGHGTATQILKANVTKLLELEVISDGGAMQRW